MHKQSIKVWNKLTTPSCIHVLAKHNQLTGREKFVKAIYNKRYLKDENLHNTFVHSSFSVQVPIRPVKVMMQQVVTHMSHHGKNCGNPATQRAVMSRCAPEDAGRHCVRSTTLRHAIMHNLRARYATKWQTSATVFAMQQKQ